ncbi:MAG: hypothetical protein ACPG4T_13790 [Nannocystaceae bacterium]
MQLIDAEKWKLGRVDEHFELYLRELTYPETLRFVRWLTQLAGREVAQFLGEYLGDSSMGWADIAPYAADLVEKLAANDHHALFCTLWGKSQIFDSPTLHWRSKLGAENTAAVVPEKGEDAQPLVFQGAHLSAYNVAAATIWMLLGPSGAHE